MTSDPDTSLAAVMLRVHADWEYTDLDDALLLTITVFHERDVLFTR